MAEAAPDRLVYPHPPVVEVICQVTFSEPVPWSVASPGVLFKALEDEYPADPRPLSSVEAIFDTGDGQLRMNQGDLRFIFSNEAQSRRIVANQTCLSVNALQPYEEWPSVADRFRRAIVTFTDSIGTFSPASVNLRYINRIVIPAAALNVSDYFTIPLVRVKQDDAVIEGFVTRSQYVSSESSVSTTITFASQEHPADDESAFVLDIELSTPTEKDATTEDLIRSIENLHRLENVEFESSLTQKCRELFT